MAMCLVTGGCGFIGSHLVEHLIEAGHTVRVLDDLSTGRLKNLDSVEGRFDFLEGSVTDLQMVQSAAQGVNWLFHLAALPSVQRSLDDPTTTHAVCATGTLNVLEAARRAKVQRVIYAASSSAYGDVPGAIRREHGACRPLSPYAAAKLAGEHYCQSFGRCYGLETVRLRFFNIFGPRQNPEGPYAGVVARFVAAVCSGEAPVIQGDGQQSRDFTYVENAVQALLLAAQSSKAPGNVYNLGAGGRTSVNQLAEILSGLLGTEVEPIHVEARPGDVRHSRADLRRARQDLGYEPLVDLPEGLRRTIEACKNRIAGRTCPPCEQQEESPARLAVSI
jgi:UDP-glucose 4-epimerase